jgi:serine/threonine-protein kinase HipA
VKRCPITYEEIPASARYSPAGLRLLSRRLRSLQDLPYSAEEQRQEAVLRAAKMSIQGVQPKLSARLNVAEGLFEVVDTGGEYILKPQTHFLEVPQNEDVTMRLAERAGIEVPLHGLVYSVDGTLTYFIKRFDRAGKQTKLAVEDFAQLSGRTRDTKYESSMEQVASIVEKYSTFPLLEKQKLFRLTVFNFLVGNEDMHLKNFSLIRRDGKLELTPAYDLVNTTIALRNVTEEVALPIGGKKRKLTRSLLVDYFGAERLRLTAAAIDDVLHEIAESFAEWETLVRISFLSDAMKRSYAELVAERRTILRV